MPQDEAAVRKLAFQVYTKWLHVGAMDRLEKVLAATGKGKSTIYRWKKEDEWDSQLKQLGYTESKAPQRNGNGGRRPAREPDGARAQEKQKKPTRGRKAKQGKRKAPPKPKPPPRPAPEPPAQEPEEVQGRISPRRLDLYHKMPTDGPDPDELTGGQRAAEGKWNSYHRRILAAWYELYNSTGRIPTNTEVARQADVRLETVGRHLREFEFDWREDPAALALYHETMAALLEKVRERDMRAISYVMDNLPGFFPKNPDLHMSQTVNVVHVQERIEEKAGVFGILSDADTVDALFEEASQGEDVPDVSGLGYSDEAAPVGRGHTMEDDETPPA